MINVRFRLIGINQDNRADGTGKAGLTFQAIGNYSIESSMNTTHSSSGGWRDSMLRKNLNDESTGTIWNAIRSTDFKNNITPVLKTTNNDNNKGKNTSNASSTTIDKLFILSPSEMGMPIIKNYSVIIDYTNGQKNANVHYYDLDSYNNTIKSSDYGNSYGWYAAFDYIYAGNAYQWWMLPAGNRTDYITTDGRTSEQQAYHNTDSYSYCTLTTSSNPSSKNAYVDYFASFMLRSYANSNSITRFSVYFGLYANSGIEGSVILAFSF